MSRADVARSMKVDPGTITRWFDAYLIEEAERGKLAGWTAPDSSRGLRQFLADKDVTQLLEDFIEFRDFYFRTGEGEPYITSSFHRSWILAVLKALQSGGELQILSPPRHGKTDLMIHFAVWLICHVPNIRIMWVGGNEDIAEDAAGAVKDHLEENEALIADFAPTGFKPAARSGKRWSSTRFTIASRNVTGVKSPTMVAIGRGGKILSRDVDLIVCDDIEDHGSTIQPKARENTRTWMTTTVGSRKEEHTAIVVIGSRQHADDLYAHLIENDGWIKITEEAHDSSCVLDDQVFALHTDCMLFPELRTYKWLMSRLTNSLTTGGRAIYEMVYLNKAIAEGMSIFKKESLFAARDPGRSIGVPIGMTEHPLVAGLDPASTGYQAAFLWLYDIPNQKMLMIDNDNTKGGGVQPAFNLIQEWFFKYDLRHWVIEENAFQTAIRQDRGLRKFAQAHGIHLEGHVTTTQNKWDETYGVTTMSPMFDEGVISLPYLHPQDQGKTDAYIKQLLNFASDLTPTGKRRRIASDLVMASWFPLKVWRRKMKESQAEMQIDYEQSYSGWDRSDDMNEAPW